MENFRRSLRYLWPYRWRVGWGVVCVIALAVLWFGGLGMILPGAKILISPEGLHGWAYLSLAQDRLQVELVPQLVSPPRKTSAGQDLTFVLEVAKVSQGPAQDAGLKVHQRSFECRERTARQAVAQFGQQRRRLINLTASGSRHWYVGLRDAAIGR